MSKNTLKDLNKEQEEAVEHKDGPLLIVAGAGTGKTTVITKRIANIINKKWACPEEVLALTFTEKAAQEMEDRVTDHLGYGYFDLWVSTFHSFAERILRQEGLEIGLPTDFKLLNEFEQYILFKRNFDKFELDHYKPLGDPTKFIKTLLNHFSRAKDEDISPDQYLEYAQELEQNLDEMLNGSKNKKGKAVEITDFQDSEGNFDQDIASAEVARIKEIANAYHTYQQLLLKNGSLDFGDLIDYCLKLFRDRPAVLEKYRAQFKYILLDEFQDTNLSQYELIKLLAAPKNNFVVCLDDDQSVYKFRGASTSNVQQFTRDYPEAKQVFLVNNYRNGQKILDISYEFIKQNDPNRLEYQLNRKNKDNKLSKELVSQTGQNGEVEVISEDSLDSEMSQVVKKIIELKESDSGATWDDFAVLVRTNQGAEEVCQYLQEADLPYILYSSKGLYNKEIIMDVIAYFRLLTGYHNDTSFFRVLNLPIFGFTTQELANFNYWAKRKAWSLFEVLNNAAGLGFSEETQKKIHLVLPLIKKHSGQAREDRASEMFLNFLNDSGLLKYYLKQENYDRETAVLLQQFLKRIKRFEADATDKKVDAFLEELQLEIDAGESGDIPVDLDVGPEAIKVMTVHAAKGLEFKYIFIPQLVDKRFPTIERKEPLPLPDPLIKEILPEGDIHLEEERRLFYVALTRGKEKVHLSWAEDYGGKTLKKPSRFLVEMGLVEDAGKKIKKKEVSSGESGLAGLERKEGSMDIESTKEELPLPSSFSYTQITAFLNCPYQYKLAHILKVPVKGKSVFSFGKTLHQTLQKTFEIINDRRGSRQGDLFSEQKKQGDDRDLISLEEILDIYEKNWIDDWYDTKTRKQENWKKGKKILKDFYAKHQKAWPRAVFLEKQFNFKIRVDKEDCAIKGAMDRIDEEQDKIKIIDYKTGQMPGNGKLEFDKKLQLLIYQMVAKQLFSREVSSLSFYYLENNQEIEFLGSDKDLEKAENKIAETIRNIKKKEFPANPGHLCRYCDFRDICEYRKI